MVENQNISEHKNSNCLSCSNLAEIHVEMNYFTRTATIVSPCSFGDRMLLNKNQSSVVCVYLNYTPETRCVYLNYTPETRYGKVLHITVSQVSNRQHILKKSRIHYAIFLVTNYNNRWRGPIRNVCSLNAAFNGIAPTAAAMSYT